MVTTHLFCTLCFSQHLHLPFGIFQSCILLSTSQHLENRYFPGRYWQKNLDENLYTYSHFERTGELNTQQESKAPSFSFWHILFPSSSSILWGEDRGACLWNNFKVYINLTHQGENRHFPLVLHKATFICHWTRCLMYITLSPSQALITNSNCLFKPFSLMPWQTYTSVTLDKCLLHPKQISERIISLQFTPAFCPLIILKHFAGDCSVPLNKYSPFNSLPTPTHPP